MTMSTDPSTSRTCRTLRASRAASCGAQTPHCLAQLANRMLHPQRSMPYTIVMYLPSTLASSFPALICRRCTAVHCCAVEHIAAVMFACTVLGKMGCLTLNAIPGSCASDALCLGASLPIVFYCQCVAFPLYEPRGQKHLQMQSDSACLPCFSARMAWQCLQ